MYFDCLKSVVRFYDFQKSVRAARKFSLRTVHTLGKHLKTPHIKYKHILRRRQRHIGLDINIERIPVMCGTTIGLKLNVRVE
jgi:hypothetical protein